MISTASTSEKNSYPVAPTLTDTHFLDPTPAFKKHVRRTLLGIVGFGMLYLLLVGFGLALGYICVFSALWLLTMSVNNITIFVSLGLLALAIMFLLFLIKFIFVVHKNENSQRIEIKAADHPRLFAFINQLTDEIKSPKPYRIYLSPNVNACVFYNSSFWSLFFPVHKNLEIGLGLVNSTNLSEFKAVMAHEFGHFSQRSMKLGNYVYVMNRVIYNLVYDRDRWDRLLDKWATSGNFWSLFAGLTYWLVNLVRLILSNAYNWLNLRYMGLSREMEYQADLVAVSSTGTEAMVTALRRVEFADTAYQQTIRYLNGLVDESKIARNLYPLHLMSMERLAQENGIELIDHLPILTDAQAAKMASPNRVNYQDQWSSHPSLQQREATIRSVSASGPNNLSSPWSLFSDAEKWQKRLTTRLYEGVTLPENNNREFISPSEFAIYVQNQYRRLQLPDKYNGFYDFRLLHTFIPTQEITSAEPIPAAEELFSDENRAARKRMFTNYEDKEILEQIKAGQISTRSFDFDGKKYNRKDVDKVLSILNEEIDDQQAYFLKLETDAFRWHYQQAIQHQVTNEFIQRYELYFQLDQERETYSQLLGNFSQLMQQIYAVVKTGHEPNTAIRLQIEELNEALQNAFIYSQSLTIPNSVGELAFPDGYWTYLAPEPLATIDSTSFNWEAHVSLYRQVEQMPNRAAQIEIAVIDELIRWQATL